MCEIEPEWRDLFERAETEPSTSYEWTSALARTLLEPSDVCSIVELRRGATLCGVAALFTRRSRVFRQDHAVLRPLAELKNSHSDVLLSDRSPETVAALIAALGSVNGRWDSFRLSKLIEGNQLTPLLEQAAVAHRYRPRRRFRKAAYWLPLPGSFEEYFASRSSKFRNYARRAEKKLRAAGRLEEAEFTTPSGFDDGYAALLQIERASWKHPHGTSIAAVPRQQAFYREWGRAIAAAGQLHLHILMLDGEPIAHNLGCIHRGCYYYLKTSYSASYRPSSPATFLRLSLVRRMIERGLTSIDFCGTPYEWEQHWADTYRWHHVLSIYAPTLRGRLFGLLDQWTHYASSGRQIEHEDPRSERPPVDSRPRAE